MGHLLRSAALPAAKLFTGATCSCEEPYRAVQVAGSRSRNSELKLCLLKPHFSPNYKTPRFHDKVPVPETRVSTSDSPNSLTAYHESWRESAQRAISPSASVSELLETRTPVAERRLGTFSGLVWLEVWRTADFTPCHSQLI